MLLKLFFESMVQTARFDEGWTVSRQDGSKRPMDKEEKIKSTLGKLDQVAWTSRSCKHCKSLDSLKLCDTVLKMESSV